MKAAELSGVTKNFGPVSALAGIDLHVEAEEFLVVLGATGAGKTTLLRVIAGLETPDAGTLQLQGRDALELAPAERDVALVFQNFSLYPSKSVRENLAFGLRAPKRRCSASEIAERVAWAAKLLRVEHLLDRPSRALSGGEMQRVAIGRAIVRRAKLFLMDEPLSNLDAKLREELRAELRELARGLRTPVVWVTHDSVEALSLADRVAVLREGRIEQVGTPEEVYFHPVSAHVARQLGNPPINQITARVVAGAWTAADGTVLARAHDGAPPQARLGFRAEHVVLESSASDADWPGGVVEQVEDIGATRIVLVRWAGITLRAFVERGVELRPGERVRARVDSRRINIWPSGVDATRR